MRLLICRSPLGPQDLITLRLQSSQNPSQQASELHTTLSFTQVATGTSQAYNLFVKLGSIQTDMEGAPGWRSRFSDGA